MKLALPGCGLVVADLGTEVGPLNPPPPDCFFSPSCRKVSRLRVSMISADFSHTPSKFCFKQSPTPACFFAMPLLQLCLPLGGHAAGTGFFPSVSLCAAFLPLKGLCLRAGHAWSQIETLPFPSAAAYGLL